MKISSLGKEQASILSFCLYFLVYTISPLTFTVSDKQVYERQCSTRKAALNAKRIHVLPWNFVIEGFFSREASSQNHDNTSVLIKKKRALVPEITSAKLIPFERTSIPASYNDSLAPATYGVNVTPSNTRNIHKGFYSIYAGHSPPSTT